MIGAKQRTVHSGLTLMVQANDSNAEELAYLAFMYDRIGAIGLLKSDVADYGKMLYAWFKDLDKTDEV